MKRKKIWDYSENKTIYLILAKLFKDIGLEHTQHVKTIKQFDIIKKHLFFVFIQNTSLHFMKY